MPRKSKTFAPIADELIDVPTVAEPLTEVPDEKPTPTSKTAKTAKTAKKPAKSKPIDIAAKKPNAWLLHVAKVRAKNPDKTYKEVLSLAKPSYKKPK